MCHYYTLNYYPERGMKKNFTLTAAVLMAASTYANTGFKYALRDSTAVIELNKQAFSSRLVNPGQTVNGAGKALDISRQINYVRGLAESNRVIGVGYYYLDKQSKAITHYITALNYFEQLKDLFGQGKVYNNIGNLYRYLDSRLSLDFYGRSLAIALKTTDNEQAAGIYNSMGMVYYHQKSFTKALRYYSKSNALYTSLNDSVNMLQCAQNTGNIHLALHQYDQAEPYLVRACAAAKKLYMNEAVVVITYSLAQTYIGLDKFKQAEKTIREGIKYASFTRNNKLSKDFEALKRQMEQKRRI